MIQYFRYPQYGWAKTAFAMLQKHGIDAEIDTYIDLPCGDGIFTYWLSKSSKDKHLVAIDFDEKMVQKLQTAVAHSPQILVQKQDIFNYQFESENCLWFFINSLYLLPNPDRLFHEKRVHPRFILTVTPNIDADNYRYFQKRNPGFNVSQMSRKETEHFFSQHGYTVLDYASVTRFAYFSWFSLPGLKYIFNLLFLLFDQGGHYPTKGQYDLTLYRRFT